MDEILIRTYSHKATKTILTPIEVGSPILVPYQFTYTKKVLEIPGTMLSLGFLTYLLGSLAFEILLIGRETPYLIFEVNNYDVPNKQWNTLEYWPYEKRIIKTTASGTENIQL
jgi:hypothetical protein